MKTVFVDFLLYLNDKGLINNQDFDYQKVAQDFSNKNNVVCCGVLEKMNLGWMKLEDGTKCMPYIKGNSGMYRVNNCPSCGKYVRDVMI